MSRKMVFVACLAIFGLAACTSSSNNNKSEVDTSESAVSQAAEATPEPANDSAQERVAVATLESRSGSSVTGVVTFTEADAKDGEPRVTVSYEIQGLTPGETRGFHVHETGDCSAPDATSAGGHFNPYNHDHGAMDAEESHVGDLGNITADAQGNAVGTIDDLSKLTLKDGELSNIVGRSVIVHAQQDDLVSQPTGDAGGRVACGVVTRK